MQYCQLQMSKILATITILLSLLFLGLILSTRFVGLVWPHHVIAYLSYEGIGLLDVDHRFSTLLVDSAVIHGGPPFRWSPDGNEFVFSGWAAGESNSDIYMISLSKLEVHNLSNTVSNDEREPTWSPDGHRLAFLSLMWAVNENYQSYVVNSELRIINVDDGKILYQSDNAYFRPAWSPDGKMLAFALVRDDGNPNSQVRVIDVETGSIVTQLSQTNVMNYFYLWSPDGRWLAFLANRDGVKQIYVVDTTTGETHTFNVEYYSGNRFARWSPDSQQIAFETWENTDDMPFGKSIVNILDISSGQITKISREGGGYETPNWSPDGKWLLFSSTPDFRLYFLNRITKEVVPFTAKGYTNSDIAWSPDSHWLTFIALDKGVGQVHVLNVDTLTLSSVSDDNNYPQVYVPVWQP